MRPVVAIAHANLVGGIMDIVSGWAVELEDYAGQLGYSVIDISGMDLVYERFTEILKNTHPAVLFNFSYGGSTFLIGNPVNGIMGCTLTMGKQDGGMPNNLGAVVGAAVIAYSDHSASQLGPAIIKSGSPSFAGFSQSLVITSDRAETQDIFKNSLLLLAKRILEGHSMGEAVEETRADLLKNARKYEKYELISLPLLYNRKFLTQLGDPDWNLKEV